MTILEMLEQSGSLSMLGMGVVFGFLIIMVFCVLLMGKIAQAFGAGKGVNAPGSSGSSQASDSTKSTVVAAVITAAVNKYQNDNS